MVEAWSVDQQRKRYSDVIGPHTRSLHLLVTDKQWTCIPPSHTHTLAEGSEYGVVLLLLPDLSERLAVLQFKVVIFCDTANTPNQSLK